MGETALSSPTLRRSSGTGSPGKTGPGGIKACSHPGGLTVEIFTGDKVAGGEQRREGGECVTHTAVWDSSFPGQRREVFLIYLFQQEHLMWGHLGEGCLG